MNDTSVQKILAEGQTIAIIGAKDDPGQAVTEVGQYLIEQSYTVLPVHPTRGAVWGLKAVPTILELKITPDIVVLFRDAKYCSDHAKEVLALQKLPKLFWMQLGIENSEASRLMLEAGVEVVANKCIMLEHSRLLGM